MSFEYVKEELLKNSSEDLAKFNTKLCPDTKKQVLGVKIPVLRKLAKQIVKEDGFKFLNEFESNQYMEEVILEGLVIAYLKMNMPEKLNLIKDFVPKIDSWCISDTFCPTINLKDKDLKLVWEFILPYTNSTKEFEVRFAVIMMLDYFLIDSYIDDVISVLDSIKNDGYYAKMAVAWTIAEIGIKYNAKAMSYLKGDNFLDKFTYNKALQKMIESYRIKPEQKEILKKMKRAN